MEQTKQNEHSLLHFPVYSLKPNSRKGSCCNFPLQQLPLSYILLYRHKRKHYRTVLTHRRLRLLRNFFRRVCRLRLLRLHLFFLHLRQRLLCLLFAFTQAHPKNQCQHPDDRKYFTEQYPFALSSHRNSPALILP